jgi:hypothetical protein
MATITAASGGGDWTTGSTWVGGTVPTVTDDAVLGASSGNVNVTSGATCKTLTCTGYTGTLNTNAQSLTVAGSITLGSGMTVSGTGTLVMSATGTLTSNGVSCACSFTISFGTGTLTVADNAVFAGNFSKSSTTASTANGTSSATLSFGGSLSVLGTLSGTLKLIATGTGTWTGSSNTARYLGLDFDINCGSGTLTFASSDPRFGGGKTLKYVSGTVVSIENIGISNSCTLDLNGITIEAITVDDTAATITLNSNLSVTTLTATMAITWAGTGRATINTYVLSNSTQTFNASDHVITTMRVTGSNCLIAGNYTVSITNLILSASTILKKTSGTELTVENIEAGTANATTTIRSETASSSFNLNLTGTSATSMKLWQVTFTDVVANGQKIWNYQGGTLTRTTNIENFTDTPGYYSDPGEANVKTGVPYKYKSISNNKTGNCAVPAASNVLLGVAVDATTGTFNESARNTDPGENKVQSGTTYKIQNVSKTGTLSGGGGSTGYSKGRVVNA